MNIDTIGNSVMLLMAIIGILVSLFHYIETPRRGWLYLTGFFLSHFLSDYYWGIYTLVLHKDPEVSALMAYFGWNLGYVLLILLIIKMRPAGAERYFNPLMLIPVPLNISQFILYLPFGGLANNIWQGTLMTVIAVLCLQGILYHIKKRKEGIPFPHINLMVLCFAVTEYGMWTSSCFDWPDALRDPYYYFAFANCLVDLLMIWAVGKDYAAEGVMKREKTAGELKFQALLQILAVCIFIGGCTAGYYIASWMKNSVPADMEEGYDIIAVTLFIISIVLVILILAVLFVIAFRYRNMEQKGWERAENKGSRYSFVVTIIITLALMIFSVAFTSRLFYKVSVNGILESGEDTSALVATELTNYLTGASSAMQVTADTINLMLQRGESQDRLRTFLTDQTVNQAKQFDENFTGIYGYLRGEYMDGSGWVPPEGYVSQSRDWYKLAVEGGGDVIMVPPYIDAHTHKAVITICKLISDVEDQASYDGRNVVALDVITNYIQYITENADVNGKGYGFVIDQNGMIVAHRDPELVGENVSELLGVTVFDRISKSGGGKIDAVVHDEDYILFVSPIMNNWNVVIAVSDAELFEEANTQLAVSILVSFIIFSLISIFYYLGYKNEQAYYRKMEEMRVEKQHQDYEARVLKLEKKSADEANKAKSRFLADMSHEIRTPINAILGMNEMILREAEGDSIREYARNISTSGRNLLQLINSILDFSKIEDGKMEIVPVRYGVAGFITYLVNSVSERAKAKGLELSVDVDPSIPSELYGDDTRLGQVVMNLLTNAVKYTPEGSVLLSIKERRREDGNILLYMEVKDTGMGIREEDMERLFESFERLDLVKNRSVEGTGLGMSITTKLLKLMDSELKVESVYGRGSVFYFEVWQRIENEEPIGEYRTGALADEGEASEAGILHAPDAHILIVDDTRMNLIVAVSLLKRTKIRIDTASSGEEAIALAGKTAYDVIFMDQRMPGMDGTEALAAIRALENGLNKGTPVICLTADAIRGARERYMAEGFTDYLTKPVNGAALERILLEYLPGDKTGRAVGDEAGTAEADEITGDTVFAALEAAGIDTDKGMVFCQGDEELYKEILVEYARDHAERSGRLKECYASEDWKEYHIYAHSLKSSSKTIGAMRLSSLAEGLEKASQAQDAEAVRHDHAEAMELYEKTASVIKERLMQDAEEGLAAELIHFDPVEEDQV